MISQIDSALQDYLNRYGWDYVKKSDTLIATGWQGEHRSFPLSIEITDTWVSFIVQPFLNLSIDWESWPEIALLLLEMNERTSMAKFSKNCDGCIVLSLDVFAENLSFQIFSDVIGLVGYYAEILYDELLTNLDAVGFRYCESLNILA